VFNTTFNISVLMVEETGVLGENHWPAIGHLQTLSHNAISSAPCKERNSTHTLSDDRY
jgi:hypothetical protein